MGLITATEKSLNETLEIIRGVEVHGKGKEREVTCPYCGALLARSVIPHLRKNHLEKWQQWREVLHHLRKKGLNSRKIMVKLNTLFSWTVIEKELLELAEEKEDPLVARPTRSVKRWKPQEDERPRTTLWDFPERGDWAVHSPDYRGNWSPYIPRHTIQEFTSVGELVLDPMVGGGTTLIECQLLDRGCLAMDISPHAIATSVQKMSELRSYASASLVPLSQLSAAIIRGDARRIPVRGNSVDMICTHPPYGPAIRYTANVHGDLSRLSVKDFLAEMKLIIAEFLRVLKPERHCALLIGDYRSGGRVVPLGFKVLGILEEVGFQVQEVMIKAQHQDSSTGFYYNKPDSLPFRIAHEYLLIVQKPE